ncbi:dammarenediol 12-hydroxylase-like protein [Cinnamomum micranthum f. kanehirae]|uniref:Dammarenediol 12-hydroxylase-like protein n=1 Tax=Cinnamomum micranthum f. kanehirae TaxID=337451 RepID=A0A443P2W1_9MAGN|nr:dammarenediol 12-hydroxylase-like protein [Cinnamomum micranthum f. kanehirae]
MAKFLLLGHSTYKILLQWTQTSLPPGSFGWPTIGEFMDLQRTNRSGKPYEFTTERMERYNKHIFKTSLFGEKIAVLCGPAANKLLFTSETKLVQTFWPPSNNPKNNRKQNPRQ